MQELVRTNAMHELCIQYVAGPNAKRLAETNAETKRSHLIVR